MFLRPQIEVLNDAFVLCVALVDGGLHFWSGLLVLKFTAAVGVSNGRCFSSKRPAFVFFRSVR